MKNNENQRPVRGLNPARNRPGESIGGGVFIFRRGDGTGRIRPAPFPFEHPSVEAAMPEALRLAKERPGYQFDVVQVVASITDKPDVIDNGPGLPEGASA